MPGEERSKLPSEHAPRHAACSACRRWVLRGGTAVIGGLVAGCADRSGGRSGPAETPVTIETTAQDCGGPADEAVTVSFGADRREVTGTIPAPTPCYTITLESWDTSGAAVTIGVGPEAETVDGECVQCVGAIDYQATIAGGEYDQVRVEHPDTAYAVTAFDHDAPAEQVQVETAETACLGGDDGTDPTVTRTDGGIQVAGTRQSPTPCYIAVVDALWLADATLVIDIGLGATVTDEVCKECLGEVHYTANVPLPDPGTVEAVRVEHGGEVAATVEDSDFDTAP